MTWHTTDDPADYLAQTGAFLRTRATENTLLLTVAGTLRDAGRSAFGSAEPLFGWWQQADGTVRRRGYAAAVTAAVSRAVLDAGANEVVLYTDLSNPTSTAVYQRLGYQPVEDRITLSFVS